MSRGIGIVGCGAMGRQHALAWAADPRAKILGVVDIDTASAHALAEQVGAKAFPSLEDLLSDSAVDLVDVVTPLDQHVEPATKAILAGKDVFVEKPLAMSVAGARGLVDLATSQGATLAVNFNRRFSYAYDLLHRAATSGELGSLRSISLRIASEETLASHPHHYLLDLGIHLVDLASHLGGDIARVSAFLSRRNEAGPFTEMAAILELGSGSVANLQLSMHGSRLHDVELAEVIGTAGRGVVHNAVSGFDLFANDSECARSWRPKPFGGRSELLQFYPTTITAHIRALLDALEAGSVPPVSGQDGLAAQQAIEAIIMSHERGVAVAL